MQEPWRQRAFTVVEIATAVALLAIFLALAIPAIDNAMRSNRVAAQANELHSMLLMARSEAVRRRAEVSVIFTQADNGWQARIPDPDDEAQSLRAADFSGSPVGLNASQTVVYDRIGRASFSGGGSAFSFFLEHHDCSHHRQRREIRVRPSGRAQINPDPESLECT